MLFYNYILQAYHLGMTRENGYIWILFSWYGSNWWTRGQVTTQTYSPYNCSQTEREAFIEGVFLIDHFAFVEEDQKDIVTDLGLVSCVHYIVLVQLNMHIIYCVYLGKVK